MKVAAGSMALALLVMHAGCLFKSPTSHCSNTIPMELDYDTTTEKADSLTITLSDSTHGPFDFSRQPNRLVDTLAVKIKSTLEPVTVIVEASAQGQIIGCAGTTIRWDCPNVTAKLSILAPAPETSTCAAPPAQDGERDGTAVVSGREEDVTVVAGGNEPAPSLW